jgi:uncharacterized protein YbjT (DUF2867 family)
MEETILVTGATGTVGSEVVKQLSADRKIIPDIATGQKQDVVSPRKACSVVA